MNYFKEAGTMQDMESAIERNHLGVPMLQLYGMAVEPRLAPERNVEPYPHMLRWMT